MLPLSRYRERGQETVRTAAPSREKQTRQAGAGSIGAADLLALSNKIEIQTPVFSLNSSMTAKKSTMI